MFYFIFKQVYKSLGKKMDEGNRARIAGQTMPPEIDISAIPYANDGDEMHTFNLYTPAYAADNDSLPLIIDIHGGGWISGDRDTNGYFCSKLAMNGFKVAAPSYRTVDACTIREQIEDIFLFFKYIESHAAELKIRPGGAALTGDSAGGQLALLAYRVNRDDRLRQLFDVKHAGIRFDCLILNHSVCYMSDAGNLPGNPVISRLVSVPGLRRTVFGRGYKKSPLYAETADPPAYINSSTPLPPVLLITSEGDTMYRGQTERLYGYLKREEKDCELYYEPSPEAGHVFNITDPDGERSLRCNDNIIRFIRRNLNGGA